MLHKVEEAKQQELQDIVFKEEKKIKKQQSL
jgi:hypothetical protein